MGAGLIESAIAVMRASSGRLEASADNVANMTTPGYRRRVSYSEVTASIDGTAVLPRSALRSDLAQATLTSTGNSLDLAINGSGFFQLRDGEDVYYTRAGHFRVADDGRLVSSQGYALQLAGGGDASVENGRFEVLADGTILAGERPLGRIIIMEPSEGAALESVSGSLFMIAGEAQEASGSALRQGMVEGSNVSLGQEMVGMMAAVRQAESGARIVQAYDDLVGRAITTFGQSGR
jgi:flagellar basal-body rod protein FlgF